MINEWVREKDLRENMDRFQPHRHFFVSPFGPRKKERIAFPSTDFFIHVISLSRRFSDLLLGRRRDAMRCLIPTKKRDFSPNTLWKEEKHFLCHAWFRLFYSLSSWRQRTKIEFFFYCSLCRKKRLFTVTFWNLCSKATFQCIKTERISTCSSQRSRAMKPIRHCNSYCSVDIG